MRFRLAAFPWALPFLPVLAVLGSGCATGGAQPAQGVTPVSDTTASAATAAPPAPTADPAAGPSAPVPAKAECDAFMDVVARTTILRASIQRDPPSPTKAAEWAAQSAQLANEAKAQKLSNPDLVIENADLATRLSDLSKDLRALADAEKSGDPAKKAAAHKRVLDTSEQVEVLTREPAARCAGDTKRLIATSGRLPAAVIQRALRDRFPLATKCYEAGLARDPKLEGRVLVRLVIGLDGKVTEASPATSDAAKTADAITPGDAQVPAMPDAGVTACVVDVLRRTVFPPPDGGTVTVVYPVTFSRTK